MDFDKRFTLIVSVVLVFCGILGLTKGHLNGWIVIGWGLTCALIVLFKPMLDIPFEYNPYQLTITKDQITCTDPQGSRQSILWKDVNQIWSVAVFEGQHGKWISFVGDHSYCSIPTEAEGFEQIFDELKKRFPDFDYRPIIEGGADDARHLCWKAPEDEVK